MEPADIDEKIRSLTSTLTNLIHDMNEKLTKFKQNYNETLTEIQDLKKETENIKIQMKEVKSIEWESRNKNIIIFGLHESKYEGKLETCNRVTKLFSEVLRINFEANKIDNLYRIGKSKSNRPLLIKFNSTITKDIIINKKRLFGKWKVRVDEDFNPEVCNIRKRLVKYMWMERKNGKHAILSKDKILVNNIPFDLHYYEQNYPLEPEKSASKENEKSEITSDEWSKIQVELSRLNDCIQSIKRDSDKFFETKANEKPTPTADTQTTRNHNQDSKRTPKLDDNWTLARPSKPGNLEHQTNYPGTSSVSRKPTYLVTAEPAFTAPVQTNSRTRINDQSRSTRVGNHVENNRSRYFLRNRHVTLPPQPGIHSHYPI